MHVSLYVSDIKKSVDFYSRFFRQPPVKVRPAYAKYVLENPSLIISFVENKERVQSNFGHLGFQVETPEELNSRLLEAKAEDLVQREEIGTNCCYAKQDKFWVNDPDNVQWEVYYFHADAEFNDPHYELKEASACCTVSSAEVKSGCGCNADVTEELSTRKVACC
ncbi:glyoxalase/bleomycin resistance/dioxygenase family protein [Cytophagales bacterium WSM2-2]|nr:glyoxalase/bleomycin resistance/dioxygenase family protein [Cytophagales bacterium WSM2-2]